MRLAHPWVRAGIVVFWLLIAGWLVYWRIWLPTHQPAPLPTGFQLEDITVDDESLGTIEKQLRDRLNHSPRGYDQFGGIFQTPGPTLPPTVPDIPPLPEPLLF